jgi:hypothetical protein
MLKEAMEVYRTRGKEGFGSWFKDLPQEQKDKLSSEVNDIVNSVSYVFEELRKAIQDRLIPALQNLLDNIYDSFPPEVWGALQERSGRERHYKRRMARIEGRDPYQIK